jgi:hypothetical protein
VTYQTNGRDGPVETLYTLQEAQAMRLWQPIETAPKDGTKIMLYCPRLGVCGPGHWEVQRYLRRPKPFWSHWGETIWGIQWLRADQPTHWMPLPEPPK